jgi:hypothetical protein
LRESSKIDKTKLPGDTYEMWLGTQRNRPVKDKGPQTSAPDFYETWMGKRVEMKTLANRAEK